MQILTLPLRRGGEAPGPDTRPGEPSGGLRGQHQRQRWGTDNGGKANKTAWIGGHKALSLPGTVSITEKEGGREAQTFFGTFRKS